MDATRSVDVPDLVPQLSRGKHRNPRKGACFMELASYLAGERWSDRPSCTHPLLAALARLVNDHTSDEGRDQLGPLVPSVIGLTSDDPRVDIRIALRAATAGLPVASAERQRVLAVSVISARKALAELDRGPSSPGAERGGAGVSDPDPDVERQCDEALASAPDAAAWARRFTDEMRGSSRGFGRHAAPSTVRYAVVGIASACIPDPDARLRRLLSDTIDDTAALVRGARVPTSTFDADRWAEACRLSTTGARR
jgi:hypothetical protein